MELTIRGAGVINKYTIRSIVCEASCHHVMTSTCDPEILSSSCHHVIIIPSFFWFSTLQQTDALVYSLQSTVYILQSTVYSLVVALGLTGMLRRQICDCVWWWPVSITNYQYQSAVCRYSGGRYIRPRYRPLPLGPTASLVGTYSSIV